MHEPPQGFRHVKFSEWNIWVSPALPVTRILDSQGADIGLLLGWVINDGSFIFGDSTVQLAETPDRRKNPFHSFCGRFVIFCDFENTPSLLTDAGALFPVVYDRENQIVASSSAMIPGATLENRDSNLLKELDLVTERGWYPFGLTAHGSIRRMLPNRRLDLNSFVCERIWPLESEQDFRAKNDRSDDQLLSDLCNSLSKRVKTISMAGPTIMHLTGGWDTRMMLSAAKGSIDRINLRTYRTGGSGGKLDQQLAALLSRKFKLEHEFIDLTPVTEEERKAWLMRTGYCLNDHVIGLSTTEKKVSKDGEFTLAGAAGEVARAFYWGPKDIGKSPPSAETLLQRLGFRPTDIFVKEAQLWLDSLPKGSASWVYDLAYIELRLGCWAGVAMTGHDIAVPSFSPFNSPDTFETMMSFSDPYRADGELCKDITRRLWPELLSLPINRAAGFRKLFFLRQELSAIIPPSTKEKVKKYLRK
jgi:hypothetical protein